MIKKIKSQDFLFLEEEITTYNSRVLYDINEVQMHSFLKMIRDRYKHKYLKFIFI